LILFAFSDFSFHLVAMGAHSVGIFINWFWLFLVCFIFTTNKFWYNFVFRYGMDRYDAYINLRDRFVINTAESNKTDDHNWLLHLFCSNLLWCSNSMWSLLIKE
jgi:hypothetical protein